MWYPRQASWSGKGHSRQAILSNVQGNVALTVFVRGVHERRVWERRSHGGYWLNEMLWKSLVFNTKRRYGKRTTIVLNYTRTEIQQSRSILSFVKRTPMPLSLGDFIIERPYWLRVDGYLLIGLKHTSRKPRTNRFLAHIKDGNLISQDFESSGNSFLFHLADAVISSFLFWVNEVKRKA